MIGAVTFTRGSLGKTTVPFRNGIDITRKTEVPEIFQKVFFKDSYASEICDIAFYRNEDPLIYSIT